MKRKLLGFAKISVSVCLVAYLLTLIDMPNLIARLSNIKGIFLILAFSLILLATVLKSLKWKLILESDGITLSYLFLLRTCYIGNFLSLFLPTSVGGDIYRVVTIKSGGQSLAKSTSSVLFDRFTGLFALISIALVSYIFLPGSRYHALLVALYISLVLAFIIGTSDWVLDRVKSFQSRVFFVLSSLLASLNAYRKNTRTLLIVAALAFLTQFLIVAITKVYCLSLGVDMPFAYLLVIVPLIYLTEMLPISINGIGVRESAFVFFFALLGYATEEGLAVALLLIVMRYMEGLIGGAFLLSTVIKEHWRTEAP